MKKLIDIIDDETQGDLLNLQHKLQDLQLEIEQKLEKEAEHPDEYLTGLQQLLKEVNIALQSLDKIMSQKITAISDGDEA